MGREELHGYLYVLAASTLWGVSTVVAKSLFALGIPPAQLVLIRLVLSVLILLLVFLCFNRSCFIIPIREIPYLRYFGLGRHGGQSTHLLFHD